jgi:citrate synthase
LLQVKAGQMTLLGFGHRVDSNSFDPRLQIMRKVGHGVGMPGLAGSSNHCWQHCPLL